VLYVFNTLIIPCDFSKSDSFNVRLRKIEVEEAREILKKNGFISAIGHEATAALLTEILNTEILMNRVSIRMDIGDRGLHFMLYQRLPEGKILTKEELEGLKYDLILSEVI
jgi:hypothetical protein